MYTMSYLLLHITDFQAVIAELLVARAEPHTLVNLVTHRSQKFWLSLTWLSIQYLKKIREQHHYRRYILDIGHPCYSYLTAVKTRYQLTIFVGSGLELIEVVCFLFVSLKLTVDPVPVFRLDCRFNSGIALGRRWDYLQGQNFGAN